MDTGEPAERDALKVVLYFATMGWHPATGKQTLITRACHFTHCRPPALPPSYPVVYSSFHLPHCHCCLCQNRSMPFPPHPLHLLRCGPGMRSGREDTQVQTPFRARVVYLARTLCDDTHLHWTRFVTIDRTRGQHTARALRRTAFCHCDASSSSHRSALPLVTKLARLSARTVLNTSARALRIRSSPHAALRDGT